MTGIEVLQLEIVPCKATKNSFQSFNRFQLNYLHCCETFASKIRTNVHPENRKFIPPYYSRSDYPIANQKLAILPYKTRRKIPTGLQNIANTKTVSIIKPFFIPIVNNIAWFHFAFKIIKKANELKLTPFQIHG